jgi:hypothetical protein
MTTELKVHPSFFREFATKTWVSPNEIVKELIENAFDEDATKVLVTILKDNSIVIEDDAGMDQNDMKKFLLLGSPHKKSELISPKLKRIRTGRYGTGRLSFLTSFESMKIRTCRDDFNKSIVIDGNTLDKLFTGNAKLDELNELQLLRNGTELTLKGPRVIIDTLRLVKEIRKLAILRQPLFEVYIKYAENFVEWDFNGAEQIRAPDIQGHRIPVNLNDGRITGEIIIAKRPLSEEEKGIAVMVGNHIVVRSNFGFDTKLNRVSGYVICEKLTSRFADKSALIEDEEYTKFNQAMKTFIIDTILPNLTEYEDILITREETKIYKEIDKALGQAITENLEAQEEVQDYEMIDTTKELDKQEETPYSIANTQEISSDIALTPEYRGIDNRVSQSSTQAQDYSDFKPIVLNQNLTNMSESDFSQQQQQQTEQQPNSSQQMIEQRQNYIPKHSEIAEVVDEKQKDGMILRTTRVRKPILKKTFALKKIGYKVVPYEDESDSRYSFTNENVVFVNKANLTYRAEAARGEEFLLRHIIRIVAETIVEAKHPEGKNALELQNRLIAEAIRIHDYAIIKK